MSPGKLDIFKKISVEDRRSIQTHTHDPAMLDEVTYLSTFRKRAQLPPVSNEGIMTPPKGAERSPGNTEDVN